ncbi:3-hydroxybutyryl-CoA dehydrogenase [Amycolatopsis suaedae]|uniref:3-hydroxybutyryl-CoA dehydrogenase n=1 Tax=Amycolatopsis suaedae TaxID=2510978 RepID=A0A4Q7IYV5_9PSEU|nr:3-hydroxybutyryl-CoA dehydrogenase [Amycolatopsis suaedae]RZQ60180.1 3-hydroxybutyryl-CoA dehydrogenase [Amycolatopsis suaedae]
MTVERVGVVGCGQMGTGFAEVCARAGLDVLVVASSAESAQRGAARLESSLDRLVGKGKLSEDERATAIARVTYSTDPKDLADRQFVLEAVTEQLATKLEVFAVLDEVVPDRDAVLASTTSALPIMKLARATSAPERVVGVHLFNPVPVMPLAELTASLATGEATLARAAAFLTEVLGKKVIYAKDQAGFVVNSLLVPYLMSAVRMLESGVATAEDIDRGMTLGCGHPMGPLALIDLIGLDVIAAVGEAMYDETREPLHAPPALLLRMIEGGYLGRKSGRGFYPHRTATGKAPR